MKRYLEIWIAFIFAFVLSFFPFTVLAKPNYIYDVLKNEYENNGLSYLYEGSHQDSILNVGNNNIYYYRADNDEQVNEIHDKNNVIFAGFCWQIIRTTDTGGVKLIYNGPVHNNKCDYSEYVYTIGDSVYNNSKTFGYMHSNSVIELPSSQQLRFGGTNYYYSTTVSYLNGMYTLNDPIQLEYNSGRDTRAIAAQITMFNAHSLSHYTCLDEGITCRNVKYLYFANPSILQGMSKGSIYSNYFEFSNGYDAEDMINPFIDYSNNESSDLKRKIEEWFKNNQLYIYDDLENVIYCDDRQIINKSGLFPDATISNSNMKFSSSTDLGCLDNNFQYSVDNDEARLKYPIGILTYGEANTIGANLFKKSNSFWITGSAEYNVTNNNSYHYSLGSSGTIINQNSNDLNGIRPVISLRSGTKYLTGDGSIDNPYIIGKSYSVTIQDANNSITIENGDADNIEAGALVLFKVNSDQKISKIIIQDENSNVLKYKKTSQDGVYEFTMVNGNVSITPVFSVEGENNDIIDENLIIDDDFDDNSEDMNDKSDSKDIDNGNLNIINIISNPFTKYNFSILVIYLFGIMMLLFFSYKIIKRIKRK